MKSMTGFGRSVLEINGRNYIIEIKSVNNKYCDISIKLPRCISFAEEKIKKEISNNVSRGKIDVYITFADYSDENKNIIINKDVANKYIEQFKELAKENNIEYNIDMARLANLPLVLGTYESDNDEEIENEILICAKGAINNFVAMRKREGEIIKTDLLSRISKIEMLIEQISIENTGLIEEYVVKLEKRVQEMLKADIIDKNRIAQEAVIYADKSSIEEELTRLKSHSKQFRELLDIENNAIGKKMDFIIQEMNRETNTIGSKAGKNSITKLVIDMKVELEDIREQIQNIE